MESSFLKRVTAITYSLQAVAADDDDRDSDEDASCALLLLLLRSSGNDDVFVLSFESHDLLLLESVLIS